jgi:anti-sigma factor RsiW
MSDMFSSKDRHLTDEELDAVVMGLGDAHASHVQECEACRARLEEMRAMVGSFREGVLLWSEREAKTNTEILRSAQDDSKKSYGWRMVPAMGLAAALVVGVMTPHWMQEHRQEAALRQTVQTPAAQPVSDDVLMQQVQQQLDESVPSSMTPLTALIQTEDPHKAARQAKEN